MGAHKKHDNKTAFVILGAAIASFSAVMLNTKYGQKIKQRLESRARKLKKNATTQMHYIQTHPKHINWKKVIKGLFKNK